MLTTRGLRRKRLISFQSGFPLSKLLLKTLISLGEPLLFGPCLAFQLRVRLLQITYLGIALLDTVEKPSRAYAEVLAFRGQRLFEVSVRSADLLILRSELGQLEDLPPDFISCLI
mgnify:CR=1 FL=1